MCVVDKTLKIKDFVFGDGTPRICVPLIGRTGEEIFSAAKVIRKEIDRLEALHPDRPDLKVAVIEWRADYYSNVTLAENVYNILRHLRQLFPDRIVLFSFRSEEQGGEFRNDRALLRMEDIMRNVMSSGLVDMVDVEYTAGNYNIAKATTKAHESGIKVIISYHDFEKTPHDSEIEEKLRQMEILGGDILKIAAMPTTSFDTRRIMELNQKMVIERAKPVVLIAMGELGTQSRIKGKETGACLTFATMGERSAPGQISVERLMSML